eukprot:PhM_4_TR13644/c0_g1_i1/m.67573
MSSLPSFSTSTWMSKFSSAVSAKKFGAVKQLRQEIIASTMQIVDVGGYVADDGETIVNLSSLLGAAPGVSVGYKTVPSTASAVRFPIHEVEMFAIESDCLTMHHTLLLNEGLRPVVLNMASSSRPGGGYLGGAGAQEENIFRRSTYYKQLPKVPHYPLQGKVIYTPNVVVFRDEEAKGYALLPHPIPTCFIACAAKSNPTLATPTTLSLEDAKELEHRIRLLCGAAVANGHDALVLSALGCGAFRNPPDHVADIFSKVLRSPEFYGCFKVVSFAIFDDHNSRKAHNPEGNLAPFIRMFGTRRNGAVPKLRKTNDHNALAIDVDDDNDKREECSVVAGAERKKVTSEAYDQPLFVCSKKY